MNIIIDAPNVDNDFLGFSKYREVIFTAIKSSEPRLTIGIFGEWGAGKTTLMKMLYKDLEACEKRFIPVQFNAWRYEKDRHLIIPLLETIKLHLPTRTQKFNKISKIIKAMIMGLEGEFSFGFAKLKFNPLKRDTYLEYSKNYYNVMKYLENLPYEKTNKDEKKITSFVIFIDDLDRCLPNKAFEIIESIKAFFDLNGYIFVLGLDFNVLNSYIRFKYGKESYITGEVYIEKMIQLPFFLPPLDKQKVKNVILKIAEKDEKEYLVKYIDVIPNNVRKIKRLLNTYRLFQEIGNVEKDVMRRLLILQFRWPNYYNELKKYGYKFYENTRKYLMEFDDDRVALLKSYKLEEITILKEDIRDEYSKKFQEQKEWEKSITFFKIIDHLMDDYNLKQYFTKFLMDKIDEEQLMEYIHMSQLSDISTVGSKYETIGPRYPTYQTMMSGTSMSTPASDEIISSLLKKDDEIDPNELKDFL